MTELDVPAPQKYFFPLILMCWGFFFLKSKFKIFSLKSKNGLLCCTFPEKIVIVEQKSHICKEKISHDVTEL